MTERFANAAQTTLTGVITAIDTVFNVANASRFPSTSGGGQFRLIIGDELLLVTDHTSNTLTATRGIEGTTATAHAAGSPVTAILTVGGLEQALAEVSSTVADDIAKSGPTAIDRVQGIHGRPISATAPVVGQKYVWNGTDHVPADRVFNIELFAPGESPSVLDGSGFDWADAFEAAIQAADATGGGLIVLSYTGPLLGYRISRTIDVTRTVKIVGQGGSHFFPATIVCCDPGASGFHIWGAGGPDGSNSAPDALLEDFTILTSGPNTNTTTGVYTMSDTTVPLDDAGDFADGQVIAIEGMGHQVTIAEHVADTTIGSPTVSLSSLGTSGVAPFRIGTYIKIGTAFPDPTLVINRVGDVLTLASNAATSLTAHTFQWCAPLISRIVSGGGTTTLVVAGYAGSASGACVIRHADTGVIAENKTRCHRIAVGDPFGHTFPGAAFTVLGDHANVPATNANQSEFLDCESYGNRFAYFAVGADSNVCTVRIVSVQCFDWSFVDLSHLGNLYTACHVDGGNGFLSQDALGCAACYVGCYGEGGTVSSLGPGAQIFGGTMAPFAGGHAIVSGGVTNHLQIGTPTVTACTTYFEPRGGFARYESETAGGSSLCFSNNTKNPGPIAPGFFQWTHGNVFKNHPAAISDSDNAATWRTGTWWFPDGFMIGDDAAFRNMDTAYASQIAGSRSDMTGGGPVIRDPAQGPKDSGSTDAGTPYWKKGDIVVDANLLDGCPLRVVIEPGHRGPAWQAGISVGGYSVYCPTVDNHNGSYYWAIPVGTTDTVEPDWTTAPGIGETVNDNTTVWTNVGAAAYTQPVELGGYIKYEVPGSESWAQTARQFLCHSVQVNDTAVALVGAVTLTLPVGRYRRWLWNNTAQNLLVKCASGNTVTIASGKAAEVQCTGVEMRRYSADVTP